MTESGVVGGGCAIAAARAATRRAQDQASPDALVPPQPVHEHPIARVRRRGHVQVKALPRGDAGLRSITSDHRPRAGWDLPARCARPRILSLHRIGAGSGSRGHRGGCAAAARSTARAEDERQDRGADDAEHGVWHDISRSGRSRTSQHLRKRTRHRASTLGISGSVVECGSPRDAAVRGPEGGVRRPTATADDGDLVPQPGHRCLLTSTVPRTADQVDRPRRLTLVQAAARCRGRPVSRTYARGALPDLRPLTSRRARATACGGMACTTTCSARSRRNGRAT